MIEFISTISHQESADRRRHIWMISLLATLFMTACEAPQPPPPPPPSQPPPLNNLVLIGIDTVSADNFFSVRITDALSERLGGAQQYRNAISTAPWTIPAVASALTGFYPVQHNAGQFQQQPANLDVRLPSALSESAVTLAEMLDEEQFSTGVFTSHPWFAADFGLAQGFNEVNLRKGSQKVIGRGNQWLDEPKRPGQQKVKSEEQAALQTAPTERFFSYLHFMEAHDWHLKNREELDARLADVDPALRALLRADASGAACVDENSDICQRNLVYNLAVRKLRDAIATVLQGLEDRNLLKDTLVIVYSDHGEEFWQHKAQHEKHGDPRNIFGYGHGHSLYQELLLVPMLVWHPGIKGAVRTDLVSLIDIVPSALRWLGIERSGEPLPGIHLPSGSDPLREENEPRIVYASGISYGPEAIATREGQFKSIMWYPDDIFEYFNLSKDPLELSPIKSNRLTMHFDVLTGDYIDMKNTSLASRPELDQQTLEHLKSIGYLQGVEEQPAPKAEKMSTQKADDTSDDPDPKDSPE